MSLAIPKSTKHFVFRGKKQTLNQDEIARKMGLFGNASLGPDWYSKSMHLDPIKWYSIMSYGVLTIVSIQIILYSKKDYFTFWRQKIVSIFKQNVVQPQIESDGLEAQRFEGFKLFVKMFLRRCHCNFYRFLPL